MKVLVTGGAGFIGSHLVEALVADGEKVVVVDDLSTGELTNLLRVGDQIGYFQGGCDVYERAIRALGGVDVIYHLAGRLGVKRLLQPDYRLRCAVDHVDDVSRACHLARQYSAVLVFTSSSEVYGTLPPNQRLLTEDTRCTIVGPIAGGRGVYAASKLTAEFIVEAYCAKGLRAVIARLFNVVGARQHPDSGQVLPAWVRAAIRGEPIELWDAEAERTFTPVEECVRALRFLATTPAARGRVVNVGGGGVPYTLREVAEMVAEIAVARGYKSPTIAKRPGAPDTAWMRARIPSIAVLEQLGFRTYPLELGVSIGNLFAWIEQREAACASS